MVNRDRTQQPEIFDPSEVFGESFLGKSGRKFLVRAEYFNDFQSIPYGATHLGQKGVPTNRGQVFLVRGSEVYSALPTNRKGVYSVIPRDEEFLRVYAKRVDGRLEHEC